MYLSELLPPKAEVLAAVFAVAKNRSLDVPARMEAAAKVVHSKVLENLRDELHVDLSDAVATYEAVNGTYDALPQGDEGQRARDDYESGLDDAVEAVFEKYTEHLSANWLGTNTIDSRVWEADGPLRLAESAAREFWKTMTLGKTNAQVLANAGILAGDLENFNTDDHEETYAMDTIDDILTIIKKRVGDDYDRLAVYEDIETICAAEDELLVTSAADRLGLTPAHAEIMLAASLDYGDAPDEFSRRLEAVKTGTARKPRAQSAKSAKTNAKLEETVGALEPGVLEALKFCGAGETTLAEQMGVSRSTLVNYAKGKTPFVPDAEQYTTLRTDILTRANMLLAALASMDKTEPLQVT